MKISSMDGRPAAEDARKDAGYLTPGTDRQEGAPSVNLHLSRPPLLLFFHAPTLTSSTQLILKDTVRNDKKKNLASYDEEKKEEKKRLHSLFEHF